MYRPQQVRPGQLTPFPATVAPTTEIGDMLTSIMPLIMIMMVMTTLASHSHSWLPRKAAPSDGEVP